MSSGSPGRPRRRLDRARRPLGRGSATPFQDRLAVPDRARSPRPRMSSARKALVRRLEFLQAGDVGLARAPAIRAGAAGALRDAVDVEGGDLHEGVRSISAKPASIASTLRGRTARACSRPSRRKTSVGHSLTPNVRPVAVRCRPRCGCRAPADGRRRRWRSAAAPPGSGRTTRCRTRAGWVRRGRRSPPWRARARGCCFPGPWARFWPSRRAGADGARPR